jgi:hypothetical protein
MAYEISWLIDKRLVQLKVFGSETVSEAREITIQLSEIIYTGEPPVHFLIDLLDVQPNGFPLSALPSLARIEVKNVGWTAIVVRNKVVQMIASVALRLTGRSFKFFQTHERALQFLLSSDPTLTKIGKPQIHDR